MTLEKYRKLNPTNKSYIVYKHKVYTLFTNEDGTKKVVCQGVDFVYNKYIKDIIKKQKSTSSNYKDSQEFLGQNPNHKRITSNYNLCYNIAHPEHPDYYKSRQIQQLKQLKKQLDFTISSRKLEKIYNENKKNITILWYFLFYNKERC